MVGNYLSFRKFVIVGLSISLLSLATPIFADGDVHVQADVIGGGKWKHEDTAPQIPSNVTKVKSGTEADVDFSPDPDFRDKPYSAEEQVFIYGGKYPIKTAPTLIELGRNLYGTGELPEGWTIFGKKNPLFNRFLISGDFLLQVSYADNGNLKGADNVGQIAAQLNLDLDWKITGTERIHAFIRPLEDANNKKTRYTFSGGGNEEDDFNPEIYFNPEALFLEGDLGSIWAGITGEDAEFDLPFAAGIIRLFFQNGIWVDDFFTGAAFTIPAINVPALDISNMDITFFAGFDEVESFAIGGQNVDEQSVRIFGVTAFIEAFNGYWEIGYGFSYDYNDGDEVFLASGDMDYHSFTIAYSRRYGGLVSNSVRLLWNVGQDSEVVQGGETFDSADGFLLLIENSFITRLPSTLIPYFNLFLGYNRPIRLAGQNDILQNTGINFEDDFSNNLTTLDNTAQDTYGGALGLEYLFALDKQLVVEVAYLDEIQGGDNPNVQGRQVGFGVRFQLPVSNATILRADAQYGILENDDDISSFRLEIRRKF